MSIFDHGPDYMFFPSEYMEDSISYLYPGMFLGSTEGAEAVNMLQEHHITHVLTLGANAAPQTTYANLFKYRVCDMSDCPTQLIFEALETCFEFIDQAYEQSGAVLVHCGRGISRSSTVAIAYLMRVQHLTFAQAYRVVSEKRPCAYPNIGFQIQLQLYENTKSLNHPELNLLAELVLAIQTKMTEVNAVLSKVFEDPEVLAHQEPWRIFGFFFENCHQYLGRCDIGVPGKLLVEADDISRRLQNLTALFDEDDEDVQLATRVGLVMSKWLKAQQCLTGEKADRETAQDVCDRIAGYKSKLVKKLSETHE